MNIYNVFRAEVKVMCPFAWRICMKRAEHPWMTYKFGFRVGIIETLNCCMFYDFLCTVRLT